MARGGKTRPAEADGATKPDFERSLERLEEIVAELEGSDVALERALELFEEGVGLGRACTARLDEAERKITALLEQADGTLVEQAFEAGAAAAPPERGTPAKASTARGARKPSAPAEDAEVEDDDGIPF